MINKTERIRVKSKNYYIDLRSIEDIRNHVGDEMYNVGFICDNNDNEVLPIMYISNCVNKYNGHCELVCSKDTNQSMIVISKFFISRWFIYNKYQVKLLQCLFLHELGHYVNGDYNKEVSIYSNERLENVLKESVIKEEINADAFAVDEMGVDYMVATLDKCIKIRRIQNDANADLAIMELELRKGYLLQNKSKE